MEYKNIANLNRLWSSSQFRKPIVILIGGYAGAGKSTVAKMLSCYLKYTNILTNWRHTKFRTKIYF